MYALSRPRPLSYIDGDIAHRLSAVPFFLVMSIGLLAPALHYHTATLLLRCPRCRCSLCSLLEVLRKAGGWIIGTGRYWERCASCAEILIEASKGVSAGHSPSVQVGLDGTHPPYRRPQVMPSKQKDCGVQPELDSWSCWLILIAFNAGATVTVGARVVVMTSMLMKSGPLVASARLTGLPGCAICCAGSGTAAAEATMAKKSTARGCILLDDVTPSSTALRSTVAFAQSSGVSR